MVRTAKQLRLCILKTPQRNRNFATNLILEKKAVWAKGNRAMPAIYPTPIPPEISGWFPWSRTVLLCLLIAKMLG